MQCRDVTGHAERGTTDVDPNAVATIFLRYICYLILVAMSSLENSGVPSHLHGTTDVDHNTVATMLRWPALSDFTYRKHQRLSNHLNRHVHTRVVVTVFSLSRFKASAARWFCSTSNFVGSFFYVIHSTGEQGAHILLPCSLLTPAF